MWIQSNDLGISLMGSPTSTISLDDWEAAISGMVDLEGGAIANSSENRQVGHYWLRNPSCAPPEWERQIKDSWSKLEELEQNISRRNIDTLLMIGIGGSALGPQLLNDALSSKRSIYFLDNTDPDGFDRILSKIDLSSTLFAVLSKSGQTKEMNNALKEVQRLCQNQGISFEERAIAITVTGSNLHHKALQENWFSTLPLWNWVGGRTSITGMVGLFPLMFMGRDWKSFLNGSKKMDDWTRQNSHENPAIQLAHLWWTEGSGRGDRNMVVLPYKDSLGLFGKYLQQLIMESIGKKHDRNGTVVHQGLTVYGNKGSTDQHAFVQQLRDGRHDFFAVLIGVLKDRSSNQPPISVDDSSTAGQDLMGFLLGTRHALLDADRTVFSLFIEQVDESSLGALIALFERTVGLYAERLNINAYDQPGVEAGKHLASEMQFLRKRILDGELCADSDAFDVWVWKKHQQMNMD